MNNYALLLSKLDEFIRKYYTNRLIKGVILSVALLVILFVALVGVEYYAYLSSAVRTVLFFSFLSVLLLTLGYYICWPLLKLYKIGSFISHQQAAKIIGTHFPEIQDKLLNVLQLNELSIQGGVSKELIEASIQQKIEWLTPIPFTQAIRFSQNKKYLPYAFTSIGVFLLILVVSPSLMKESSERLLHYNTHFEKPAPFAFHLVSSLKRVVQHQDVPLMIKVTGKEVPQEVYLVIGQSKYKLTKENTITFSYLLKNIQKTTVFQLYADGIYSQEYEISVYPKPAIVSFAMHLDYPAYTGKTDETLQDMGDALIPQGTAITWTYSTQHVSQITMLFHQPKLQRVSTSSSSIHKTCLNSTSYHIIPSNTHIPFGDSLTYFLTVVPDAYPTIEVEEYVDSLTLTQYYFRGTIKDDYGFSKLLFVYTNHSQKKTYQLPIEINKQGLHIPFYYGIDMSKIQAQPGEKISYSFEVWDNDGVHGPKKNSSPYKEYQPWSEKQKQEQAEKNDQELQDEMQNLKNDAKKIQKKAEDLTKKLAEKKSIGWQEKQQIQDIVNQQKLIERQIEAIKEKNKQNNLQQNHLNPTQEEEIMKKQEQINKLFDELMTDELKALLQEMEKLMSELDKDKVNELLEQIKLSNTDIKKEMDRNLEMLKQLQVEKKLDQAINQLEEVAKKQEELAKQSDEKQVSKEEKITKQKDLNADFKEVQKQLEEIKQLNKELENPNALKETKPKEEAISTQQENSLNQLKENKGKKAGESQQEAADQMQSLSEDLQAMQEDMQEDNIAEDAQALRAILENLLQISFDQERAMNTLAKIDKNDPTYGKMVAEQKRIKDNLQIVEDSLFALSKRQPSISSYVNKEINKIGQQIEQTLSLLLDINSVVNPGNYRKNEAVAKQQFAMTSINNLAVLLAESLAAMQQQMAQQMKQKGQGNGQCKSPKPGQMPSAKPGSKDVKSLRQMQEALNKQLEQLKKGMKPGEKGPTGQGMSKELAKAAAQQAAIRQHLQKLSEQMGGGSKQANEIRKMMDAMDKTETELVNKTITNETLKRQQDILTRLLESEKADKERDQDDKRESNEEKNTYYRNPEDFFKYKKIKSTNEEVLKTVPPSYKSFYKKKVNEYFYNFDK